MVDTAQAPAIGYSVTANIDGNRQIVFQCFFDEAEDDAVANARLDRIMRFVDRQRAIYALPELREEQSKLRDEIAQFDEDLKQTELNFQKAQAGLDVQILELGKQRQEHFEAGSSQAVGRRGDYAPRGAVKANMDRCEQAVDSIKEQKAKNEAEREVALKQLAISMDRRHARIAELDAQIAEKAALAGT